MGLPDISKLPKKDAMGMDYIPVYEGEDEDSAIVKLSAGKLQRIGAKSEPATMRVLSEPVRAPGTIQYDERRVTVISLRAESFIESVEDVTTGSEVRKGQPLFRFYSPAITAAGAQYLSTPTAQGSAQRLWNYAVPQAVLTEIERTKQVPTSITRTAPRAGLVLERNVSEGMRAMPGDVLFRIADHSVIWALVDVAERDLAAVHEGQAVTVRVRSYLIGPCGWSKRNVSSRLVWAPAWSAELVDVAQPATRRARARTPRVLVVCNRVTRGA
jgi:Cu(I)/Ag(I) efflux system membrane fusion protein